MWQQQNVPLYLCVPLSDVHIARFSKPTPAGDFVCSIAVWPVVAGEPYLSQQAAWASTRLLFLFYFFSRKSLAAAD